MKHDMYIRDKIGGLPCNQSRQHFGSKNPNPVSLLTSSTHLSASGRKTGTRYDNSFYIIGANVSN